MIYQLRNIFITFAEIRLSEMNRDWARQEKLEAGSFFEK